VFDSTSLSITGRQSTTSEDTGFPDFVRWSKTKPETWAGQALTRFNVGSDFTTQKTVYKDHGTREAGALALIVKSGGSEYWLGGGFVSQAVLVSPTDGLYRWFTDIEIGNLQTTLFSMGASAISRVAPVQAHADTAVFLGELFSDGIPSVISATLLKSRIGFFKSLGSDYLNVEFGWKPFVSDLRKFLSSVRDSHKILHAYKANADKHRHRGYGFPHVANTRTVTATNRVNLPAAVGQFYRKATSIRTTETGETSDSWFSGCFIYYYQEGTTPIGKLENAAK